MSHIKLTVILLVVSIAAGAWAQTPASFEQYVNYPLSQAQSVAVGDLNGDGKDDVVAGCWPDSVYLFYQDSNGALVPPLWSLTSPPYPYGMATGDLNGDTRADLAVAGSDNMVYLYYQQPDGTLGLPQSFYAGGWASSITLADLNSDGLVDIATTSSTDINTSVVILWQNSAGGFSFPDRKRYTSARNSRCLSPLDVNNDGKKDLAFLVDGSVGYMVQNAFGNFDPAQFLPASWAYSLTAGDVTGDGLEDIVFTVSLEQPSAAIGVYAQDYTGALNAVTTYGTYHYPQPLTLLDIDGDDRLDVAAAHGSFYSVSLNLQLTDGTLSYLDRLTALDTNNYQYNALAAGDLNGDGVKDLALVDHFNGLSVFLHESTGRDITPPTCTAEVSGTEGQNGWYTSAANLTLNAVDNEGIKAVYYTLDGTQWSTYSGTVTVLCEGATKVGYYAEDQAGNKSEVQWIDLKIDTQAPTTVVAASGTKAGDWFVSPVQVEVTAGDETAGSGVSAVYYTINGTDWLPYAAPVSVAAEGNTRFGCYAEDAAGNKGQASWVDVKIDTLAPNPTTTVSGTAGSNGWYVTPVRVSLAAQDNSGSGVAGIFYTVDGSAWFAYNEPVTATTEGVTGFGSYAVDVVGNQSQQQWVEVKVDTEAPVLILSASESTLWPAKGQTVNVLVYASGTDQTSGLVNLHLKVFDEYGVIQPEYDVTNNPVTVPLVAYVDPNDTTDATIRWSSTARTEPATFHRLKL